jgi:hypothetical protein
VAVTVGGTSVQVGIGVTEAVSVGDGPAGDESLQANAAGRSTNRIIKNPAHARGIGRDLSGVRVRDPW